MFCFVDDITVASKDQKTHVREDLAKALAICSKYNLLLSPKKVDLCRPDIRVLGYQLSQGAKSLSDEKKKKIKEMEFPRDKKEAVSKAAFSATLYPWLPFCLKSWRTYDASATPRCGSIRSRATKGI